MVLLVLRGGRPRVDCSTVGNGPEMASVSGGEAQRTGQWPIAGEQQRWAGTACPHILQCPQLPGCSRLPLWPCSPSEARERCLWGRCQSRLRSEAEVRAAMWAGEAMRAFHSMPQAQASPEPIGAWDHHTRWLRPSWICSLRWVPGSWDRGPRASSRSWRCVLPAEHPSLELRARVHLMDTVTLITHVLLHVSCREGGSRLEKTAPGCPVGAGFRAPLPALCSF